jgi:polyhydroxybutyrate depolymerase
MNKFLLVIFTVLSFTGDANPPETAQTKNLKSADLFLKNLVWQGRKRTYWIHLPPENKMNRPLPLLFHLHGGGGTGKGTAGLTYRRFNELADQEGFIVVYPNAIARNWNDGRKEAIKPQYQDIDDVGFIVEIVNRLKKEYPINTGRIFTTGMSNGGFMSSRLLCDQAGLFRGGAILTASLAEAYLPKCSPEKPVAVLVINGTDDPLVPYEGGDVRLFRRGKSRGKIISNDYFLKFWQEKNECTQKQPVVVLPDRYKKDGTTVSVTTYTNCKSGGALKFYKIEGGGHTWPGGKQYLGKRLIGNTSREINACDEIWAFFNSLD